MRSIRRSGSIDAFMGNRKDRSHGQATRRDLVTRITLMGEAQGMPWKKQKPASQPAFFVDWNLPVGRNRAEPLLRRRQRQRFRLRRARHDRRLLLALVEDQLVALDRDFADLGHRS